MRLASLYLRSRLTGPALAILVASGVIGWFWLREVTTTGPGLSWALTGIPLLPAMVIGASVRQPFGDVEVTASHWLPALRCGHIIALFAFGALVLLAAIAGFDVVNVNVEMLRNLAGLTGLALLGTRFLGSGISWVAPLSYGLIALLVDPASRWGWLTRLPHDEWSLAVAGALLAAGLVVTTFLQPSASDDEF